MAIMYPKIREKVNGPQVEQLAYEELCKLPDDFTVFHSVHWVRKHFNKSFTWYENDYLILHKEYGILVLEVKGGHCFFKDGLMHQVNTVTHEEHILDEGNDPLNQAQRGIQYYRGVLSKKVFRNYGSICIEPLVWFPSGSFDTTQRMPADYHDVSFAILDSSAFSAQSGVPLVNRLKAVYDGYGASQKTSISDEQMQQIKDIIAPNFDLIPSAGMIKTELDNAYIRLTNEQSVLLDYIGEQNYAAIQGPAGTGKTMIAQMAAERFGQLGRKVLYLCYNSLLCQYLKAHQPKENVDYYNVDKFVTDFCHAEAGNRLRRINAYESIDIEEFPYDDIIIDEAQDLGNGEVLFFKQMADLREGHCYVFYDKNQVVLYDDSEKTELDEEGNPYEKLTWIDQSECRLVLSKNCRNTIEIAKSAYSVIDYEVNQKLSDISGETPSIVFVEKNPQQKLADLVEYYISQGFTEDEISILSMKTLQKSFISGFGKIAGHRLKEVVDGQGILFTTARKFKGLENKVIIIIDIDESCFSNIKMKKVFYVACSRATQKLSLVIAGDAEEVNQIAASIPGGSFSSKGRIVMKTKTKMMKV